MFPVVRSKIEFMVREVSLRFSRFSGIFSFLGSYSPEENVLLDKELAITKYLKDNPWIASVHKSTPELRDFFDIQMKSIDSSQYASIGVELDSILLNLKNLTHRGDQVFDNHQPDALIGEIRAHLAARKQARSNPHQANLAQIISYKADLRNFNAKNFHAMMDTRQRVLWTLDTDGYLSIGDPMGNKHSVVAAGKPVRGAGQAQLKTDDRDDQYYAAASQNDRAKQLRKQAETASGKSKQELVENAQALEESAKMMSEGLGGYKPPQSSTRVVELDFDSGHYAPREAWKPSTEAWNEAGYKVEWSTTSKFT